MSSRRTRARKHRGHRGNTFARVAVLALVLSIALTLVGGASAYAVFQSWLKDLPDYKSPEAFQVAQATKMYSADGVLLARLYLENRTVVPISEISTDLANALVSIEDERFYQHPGIDPAGLVRAALVDIMAGSAEEGASTITQQYVDNTLLRDERLDRTLRYKAREMYLALQLEKQRTKTEILELYLNTVYFGEGAYGAEAAAKTYFAKPAKELTVPESALIAGLAQAPSRLDPYDNPDGAMSRRDEVLKRMLRNGHITQEEYDAALATPLQLKRAVEPEGGIYHAPYYVAHVKKLLQQEFDQALVFQGGLSVYTTLDTKRQKMAEDAVFGSLDSATDPDCALVSIDPKTGYVVAMVGGRDFTTNKFNLATQGRRQPGSSFKTFVLVAALEDGMPPNRYVDSSSPANIPAKPVWTVSNSEGRGKGMITMDSATRSSVNTVFARLIWELNDKTESGAAKVSKVAKRMGITSDIPAYPSIALGSQNVTPLEMASAYGTLATNGKHVGPITITKVVNPSGETVYENKAKPEQVLEPSIAYAATQILEGVISGGTASRARIGRPAAGKTGTSQNYRDAWFVGYTPDLVTSVWVGYYKTETPMLNVNGGRGFGGTLAAPIWAKYMKNALANVAKNDFPKQAKPKYKWKSEWDSRIQVPKLTGLSRGAVAEATAESGFIIAYIEEYNATVPRGFVVSQNPASGARLKSGGTMTVVISKGPQPVTPVPPPVPPPVTPPPSDPGTGTTP